MSRNLGRQYQAINSPWTDYTVYSFPDASHIAASDRQPLMDAMNGIIALNWNATEPHWTAASSPFDRKYSLILVYDGSGLVAFSVYRELRISGGLAIYRSGTEVLPAHQGRGLYGFFTSEVLKCSAPPKSRRRLRALRMADSKPYRLGGQRQDLRKGHALPARRRTGSRIAGGLRRDVFLALSRQTARSARHDHAWRLRPH